MYRLLFVFCVGFGLSAQAVKITEVKIAPSQKADGSFEAEALHVSTIWEKEDEPTLTLNVRPMLVRGEDNEDATAVLKKKEKDEFVASVVVERPAFGDSDLAFQKSAVTISFSALELPNSKNVRLGYVVALINAKKEQVTALATPWAELEVNNEVVKKISRFKEPELQEAEVPIQIIDNEGKLVKQDTPILAKVLTTGKDESVKLEDFEKMVEAKKKTAPNELAGLDARVGTAGEKKKPIVFFATNRKRKRTNDIKNRYEFLGSMEVERKEAVDPAKLKSTPPEGMTYGTYEVDMPTRAQEQSWWHSKKATLQNLRVYGDSLEFYKLVGATEKDTLLFVHGYNVPFNEALLQVARLKRDTYFPGNAMAFSWPSQGTYLGYWTDEDYAEKSVHALYYVLFDTLLTAKKAGGKVYLIAHSMGNRVVTMALRQLFLDYKDLLLKDGKPLAIVVTAAPDVDINIFASFVPSVAALSDMFTFYYSGRDRALVLSATDHRITRAGLHPTFNDSMDTINADKANGWVNHSYYSSADAVVTDMFMMFRKPHRRAKLRTPPLIDDVAGRRKYLHPHWLIP